LHRLAAAGPQDLAEPHQFKDPNTDSVLMA
jgi:hypothetical protein